MTKVYIPIDIRRCSPRDCQLSFGFAEVEILKKVNMALSLEPFGIFLCWLYAFQIKIGPRQANLVLIAYASSEGSGEPAHPRSLA